MDGAEQPLACPPYWSQLETRTRPAAGGALSSKVLGRFLGRRTGSGQGRCQQSCLRTALGTPVFSLSTETAPAGLEYTERALLRASEKVPVCAAEGGIFPKR